MEVNTATLFDYIARLDHVEIQRSIDGFRRNRWWYESIVKTWNKPISRTQRLDYRWFHRTLHWKCTPEAYFHQLCDSGTKIHGSMSKSKPMRKQRSIPRSDGNQLRIAQHLIELNSRWCSSLAGSAPSSLGNAVYKQLIASTRATGALDFEGQNPIGSTPIGQTKPKNWEISWRYLDEIPWITLRQRNFGQRSTNVIILWRWWCSLVQAELTAKPIKGQVGRILSVLRSAGRLHREVSNQEILPKVWLGKKHQMTWRQLTI